jgi:IS5 family transposase
MGMGQPGFFDHDKRLAALSEKGDPLEAINAVVPWEIFRGTIEAVVLRPASERKSNAGRKPLDAVLKFKMLVLQSLYNLSDEQVEYQVRDRLSFARFLGLRLEDTVPDATSLWLFREALAKVGLIETLFAKFEQTLATNGYIARGGQIIDATIVAVPKQRNDREENKDIKAGEVPAAWKTEPNKLAQKDCDARWTKKHGRSYFGYKNHINVDARYKLIRRYGVSDASVHDSREFSCLLDKTNTSRNVFADSAYRSADIEAALKVQGLKSRIHRRATRSHPLSAMQEKANRKQSQVRARIEHVFGAQQTSLGGRLVRTIGLVRAKAKIGLQNLVYNIRRMIAIERNAAAA